MALQPVPKRPRVDDRLDGIRGLRARLPFVSQSALAELLKIAMQEELPKVSRRNDIRIARDQLVQQMAPYGTLHQKIDVGGGVSIEVQHPLAMLHYCVQRSDALSRLVERKLHDHPSTVAQPWRLCLYTDEVSPGNQLAHTHSRKAWGIYWSFAEMGEQISAEDRALFTCLSSCLL